VAATFSVRNPGAPARNHGPRRSRADSGRAPDLERDDLSEPAVSRGLWEDSRNSLARESNEVWSVDLGGNGDFIPSTARSPAST